MTDETPSTDATGLPSPTSDTLHADPPRMRRLIEMAIVVAISLGLDLWSKAWAWENLRNNRGQTVIENWVYFEFGFNTGSAFSFLRDASFARVVFIIVTILALLYMGRLAATMPTRFRVAFVAVALVTGGALGNLHDRLVRIMEIRGQMRYGVVDFIKIYYWPRHAWPTFNVADTALVIGVGLLFIFLARHGDALDQAQASNKKSSEGDDDGVPSAAT